MATLGRSVKAAKVARLWVSGLALVMLGGVSARAQVLDQIPSDAVTVIKVNHLQETSTKLGDLMQALGVTDFAPQAADPLAALQKQSGLTEGIDKSGEFAIALLSGPWPADNASDDDKKKPPILVLVPVSDYKAFVAQSTLIRTEGDISVIHFKQDANNPQDIFVVNWGNYAVISPLKDLLSKKPDGLKATGLAAKELAEKDAVVYVNWPSLKKLALPKLQDGREKILGEMDKNLQAGGMDPSESPVVKSVVNQLLNVAQAFVEQSQATTLGISISKDGLGFTTLAEFLPDTYLANLAQHIKTTDQTLLAGLPAEKYLFFGGSVSDPKVTSQVFDDFFNPISKELAGMGDKGKAIQDMIDNYRTVATSVEGGSFGVVAPDPKMLGQSSLLQMVAVYKGDAQKLQDAQIKQIQSQQDMMKALGVKNADQVKTTVTPNAHTVDGVSFTDVQMQFNLQGNTPQDQQAAQAIKFMYGPDGLTMSAGVVDPKTLLFVVGGTDALISSSVASAKNNTDVLSGLDGVKLVDAQLPKTRAVVAYVPLDVIVSTAVGYMGKFGMPVPIQLPPNLPPLGFSIGTEGTAIRGDEYVPTPLVQSLVAAFMQVYVQMHGGAQGGGGAGGL
jgi:hypothetical protein